MNKHALLFLLPFLARFLFIFFFFTSCTNKEASSSASHENQETDGTYRTDSNNTENKLSSEKLQDTTTLPETWENITYLVSEADVTTYCNGSEMEQNAYRKTISLEKESKISKQGLSILDIAKETAMLALDDKCCKNIDIPNLKYKNGIVKIPPVRGRAGILSPYAIVNHSWK